MNLKNQFFVARMAVIVARGKQLIDNSSASWQEYAFAEHWVIHQTTSNRLLLLNDTSRYICQQYENKISPEQIADYLTQTFSISYQQALTDTHHCINSWTALFGVVSDQQKNLDCSRIFNGNLVATSSIRPDQFSHHYLIANHSIDVNLDDDALEYALANSTQHLECEIAKPATTIIDVSHQQTDYLISVNGENQYKVNSQDEALAWIIYELVESAYREKKHEAVLHAAAVLADKQQQALIFIGKQGSGKSTLVAALQTQGFSFLADDVCPLVAHKIVAIPMSQVLKQGSWDVLQSFRPELSQLASHQRLGRSVRYLPPLKCKAENWQKTWPVGALIFPEYQANTQLTCEQMHPIEALQGLIDSGALFQQNIGSMLTWLAATPAYRLCYADLSEACAEVIRVNESL